MTLPRLLIACLWIALALVVTAFPPWYQTQGWPGEISTRFHDRFASPRLHGVRRHSSQIHFHWPLYLFELGLIGAVGAASALLPVRNMRRGFCARCGYDLRGTVAAGRHECPECGEPITSDRGIVPVAAAAEVAPLMLRRLIPLAIPMAIGYSVVFTCMASLLGVTGGIEELIIATLGPWAFWMYDSPVEIEAFLLGLALLMTMLWHICRGTFWSTVAAIVCACLWILCGFMVITISV